MNVISLRIAMYRMACDKMPKKPKKVYPDKSRSNLGIQWTKEELDQIRNGAKQVWGRSYTSLATRRLMLKKEDEKKKESD